MCSVSHVSPRPTPIGPAVALALAVAALISFGVGAAMGFRSESAETVFVLTWLIGWVLVIWALIVAVGSVVVLIRRRRAEPPASPVELALLGACFALVILAVFLNPLWGSGSGAGS